MGEESLGHMIKRRRETLGFSQARLGELVGRSATTIRNWERGKSTPSVPSDAVALAAVLGLSENRVVEAAGFEMSDVESHQTLEQGYASLAPRRSSPDREPLESEPAPAEPFPSEPAPTETAEPEPVEPAPAESELVESEPAESEPAESEPAESEPAESEPPGAVPAETGPEEEPAASAPAAAEDVLSSDADEVEEEGTVSVGSEQSEPRSPSSLPLPPPGRRLQAVPTDAAPERASSDQPSVSRAAPPTVLETPPPGEPSYLEDSQERQRYRARALATAAVVVFLLIVLLWSFDRTVDAFGTMWDDFTGMLEL